MNLQEPIATRVIRGYEYLDDEHLVKKSTGEVVKQLCLLVPNDTIAYTPEQQRAYKIRKEREQRLNTIKRESSPLGRFVFTDVNQNYNDISPQSMARLVYLSTFLPYNQQVLRGHNGAPITKENAQERLNLSKNTFYRFWREVHEKYLFEDEASKVRIHDCFRRGRLPKNINYAEYQRLYINAVRSLYEKCPVSKNKHLGRIFQMLPYINIEYNILCFNPLETNIDAIEPMTVNDFCTEIGVSPEHCTRTIREYTGITFPAEGQDERFCSIVSDGTNIDSARIFVNPRILYRGTDWKHVAVLGAFTKPPEAV